MAFGTRELKPQLPTKLLLASERLLRISAPPMETIIRQRLVYKNAVPQENAFLNGDGVNKPLGVFTASDDGISTSRDVSNRDPHRARPPTAPPWRARGRPSVPAGGTSRVSPTEPAVQSDVTKKDFVPLAVTRTPKPVVVVSKKSSWVFSVWRARIERSVSLTLGTIA